jgi:hypothetical protein
VCHIRIREVTYLTALLEHTKRKRRIKEKKKKKSMMRNENKKGIIHFEFRKHFHC